MSFFRASMTHEFILLLINISQIDWLLNSVLIQIRNIHHYPFPAVTFSSGDFNSKKSFLRTFLNQFQLTRYNKNDNPKLKNNEEYIKSFHWLLSSVSKSVFEKIEEFLVEEKNFINSKGRMFKNQVCGLVTLATLRNEERNMRYEVKGFYLGADLCLRFYFKSIIALCKNC